MKITHKRLLRPSKQWPQLYARVDGDMNGHAVFFARLMTKQTSSSPLPHASWQSDGGFIQTTVFQTTADICIFDLLFWIEWMHGDNLSIIILYYIIIQNNDLNSFLFNFIRLTLIKSKEDISTEYSNVSLDTIRLMVHAL